MAATVTPSADSGASRSGLALEIIQWGEGAALLVLFVVALSCLWMGGRLIRSLRQPASGETVLYRRHFGGFGGDSSGWQISAPFVAAGLGVVLIALGVSLATSMVYVLHQHEIVESKEGESATGTAAKGESKADKQKALQAAPPAAPARETSHGGEDLPRKPADAS